MDDVLSEVARESGNRKGRGRPEVPVGEHIRAFREKQDMTVQQFAERTGFSAALLGADRDRMVSPSLGTLVKIAHLRDHRSLFTAGRRSGNLHRPEGGPHHPSPASG